MLGFAQAGSGGYFDESGFPAGQGWDVISFRESPADKPVVYALDVQGESMMPLYRVGERLIVEPGAQVRRGGKVVLKSRDGEVSSRSPKPTVNRIDVLEPGAPHPNIR